MDGFRKIRCAPRTAGLVVLAALLCISTGCDGPGGPLHTQLRPEVERPQPSVVIFLVDGLPPRFIEQGCPQGWLPNIEKRFCENGTRVHHAITCVPSVTYGVIATMLTGVSPATHGIMGNRWFDPEEALFRKYVSIIHYRDVNSDVQWPLLYERIQPLASFSIQSAFTRGLTENTANWAQSGVMWCFHDYTAVDKLTATSVEGVAAWANRHREWPSVLMCYMPGADSVGHRHGVSSRQFQRAIQNADHQIGRVCDWLDSQGLLDTTYLVLLSDHGMVNVRSDGYISLMRLVHDGWGRDATHRILQNEPEAWRRDYYDSYDTVINDHDGRRASIHFRAADGWAEPPAPEEVDRILNEPNEALRLWNTHGITLATYLTGDDEAILRAGSKISYIRRRAGTDGPEYAYVPEPDDVLGYLDDPSLALFVTAGYHDSRSWLDASAAQLYPDVVPQLIPLLHLRRAGQVVVFADPGYSFVHERGGHGGIDFREMEMTFMLAGPGIQHGGVIETGRVVDVLPTVLAMLGVTPNDDALEGVSLLDAVRSATTCNEAPALRP